MKTLIARLLTLLGYDGQCSVCQQWYPDWNGGVCGPCQAAGRS